jgi:hypothetical protein
MTMVIVFLIIFGSLFSLALKASWGIVKIVFSLLALPLVLIGMVMSGFALLLLPGLLILVLLLIFGLVL